MYKNVGKLLHGFAKLLFWLTSLTSLILAFVFGFEKYHYHYQFNAGLFFLFFAGVPIAAYIMSLLMHGFGTIVSNHEKELDKGTARKEQAVQAEKNSEPMTEIDMLPDQQNEDGANTDSDFDSGFDPHYSDK